MHRRLLATLLLPIGFFLLPETGPTGQAHACHRRVYVVYYVPGPQLVRIYPSRMPYAPDADPKKEGVVKELDLKGLKRERPMGKVDQPTVIATEEELAKAFPEEELLARLKKEVDFKKQQLVFFQWAGSGQDKLEFKVGEDKKGPEVTFQYKAGLTRDLRPHFHLYAMPKEAAWKVSK